MKSLLLALPLLLSVSAFAAEPVVVRNFDQPAWDNTHGIEMTEDLRIGGKDQDDIIFGNWVHLACDSKGQIIAADYAQNLIRRFGTDGSVIGPIGRSGDGPGEYRFITAIAVDAKDNLYVVGSNRVRIYDATDKFVGDFRDESLGMTRSVRGLPDGGVLLSEYDRPTKTVLQKYVAMKHSAHFCDAFKRSGANADMMTMQYAGGYVAIGADGMIYYTQMTPYEIRTFTPAGELVMQVFRENKFMSEPHVEKKGESMSFYAFTSSIAIFVLPDGKFLNVVGIVNDEGKPAGTVLDLFESDGHLLLSQRLEKYFRPQWLDGSGNLYSFDVDDLAVVRARMTVH